MHRLAEPLGNAALPEEVAQHQAGNERRGRGDQQCNKDRHQDGKDDLLPLGDFPQGLHDDLALFLRGEELHNGGLDHRHQSHVGVCRYRDGAQQSRGQHDGNENGGRTVGTADDADGGGLRAGKAQQAAAYVGHENAQLCGGPQQQALGVGDERAEIRHGAHTHEDQARIDTQLHAQIQYVNEPHGDGLPYCDGGEYRV